MRNNASLYIGVGGGYKVKSNTTNELISDKPLTFFKQWSHTQKILPVLD